MTLGPFANTIFNRTYRFTEKENWEACASRVARFVSDGDKRLEKQFFEVIRDRKFIPGGRYLYASGRELAQTTNCFLLKAEDSREGWSTLLNKSFMALSTGGGVGIEYSGLREKGSPIRRLGGTSSGPISLMCMVNEVARHVMAGGKRRSALWAGLAWYHPDIEEFLQIKNWSTAIKAMKEQDFDFPGPLDMTNVSVRLDDGFFKRVKKDAATADLYYRICKSMCKTGEPGFSIDVGDQGDNILRNPCCEIVSDTDGDCCNLGSINLARIKDLDELEKVTRIAVRFLYCGTFNSYLPHPDFITVREKYRRIGLGLMGLHEWCILQGTGYEPSGKLGRWLSTWQSASDHEAKKFAKARGGIIPIAVRSIAPTGTIGILGETSTGIEPIFCTAYKRRFLDGGKWKYMYVIDPTAERLINEYGVSPDDIEDSQILSKNVEKRIAMQAFVQDFVDQAISSTINLPEYGEHGNSNMKKFSETLLRYLPRLRGITVYPDNARAGQPITKIKYETAKKHKDVVFEEHGDPCKDGVCGI